MERAPSLALALCLSACGGESELAPEPNVEPPVDPATFDLEDAGPYQCGHRVLSTSYEAFPGSPARTIPVHVWYPTTATDGEHARYRGIFQDPLAWEDAPLAPSPWADGHPVLAHSHGYMGFAGNSHRMMCHFAMHGWVAVAPEHVGNTLTDTPDPLPLAAFYRRPLDVRAALDHIFGLGADDPLSGVVDDSRLAVSGHSFGIFTAWSLAGARYDRALIEARCFDGSIADCDEAGLARFDAPLAEPRAKAAIPMAGGKHAFFGKEGLAAVTLPVLLMTGSLDDVGADEVVAGADGVPLTWVDVEGGCHQLYGLGNTSVGDTACMALGDEEGFAIVNPYALAYVRYHVLGERAEQVRGLVEEGVGMSPRMTVRHPSP
jgi:predicted dienelactone hydrolase